MGFPILIAMVSDLNMPLPCPIGLPDGPNQSVMKRVPHSPSWRPPPGRHSQNRRKGLQYTMANVLVTGGTGELGRLVVAQLLAHQHTPRVLSRQTHLDLPEGTESVYGELTSGTGLREAVEGVDAIIHCASSPQDALATDIGGTRMLVHAAREAGSPHFIYVSIVGIDRAQSRYYQAKCEAERIV